MPDKPTPTDAELEALLLDKLPASKHYIRPVIEKMVAAMQAAIDKWGQPAQATEHVAVVVPGYTPSGKRVALCSAKQDLPIGTQLYTAHQPSPAAQGDAPESEYRRGYRHGYEQRDAEVRGALV